MLSPLRSLSSVLLWVALLALMLASQALAQNGPTTTRQLALAPQINIGQGCFQFNNGPSPAYSCIERISFNRSVVGRRTGYCEIMFDIDQYGRARNIYVLNAEPRAGKFVGACRTAPRRWRFTPPKTENKRATEIKSAYALITIGPNPDRLALPWEFTRTAQTRLQLEAREIEAIINRFQARLEQEK